jgi:hypothetical protein
VEGMSKDELAEMLMNEPDFKNQEIWLRELATAEGMEVEFFPKFHCEFNWIERYWSEVKRNVRKNCDYTFKTLVEAVPKYLDLVDFVTMRRYAMKSARYMDAYRVRDDNAEDLQITPELIEWNVKQYSSHRTIAKLLKIEEKKEAMEAASVEIIVA